MVSLRKVKGILENGDVDVALNENKIRDLLEFGEVDINPEKIQNDTFKVYIANLGSATNIDVAEAAMSISSA